MFAINGCLKMVVGVDGPNNCTTAVKTVYMQVPETFKIVDIIIYDIDDQIYNKDTKF